MADISMNQLYSQLTKTSNDLGESLKDIRLPKISSQPSSPSINTNIPLSSSNSTLSEYLKGGSLTTPYGGSTNYEQSHSGVDIAKGEGTPIPAFTKGTVIEKITGQTKTSSPSFGNYVVIQTPDGKFVRYSHLKDALVEVGQNVEPSTNIGTEGTTGSVYSNTGGSGSHLDLRLWQLANGYKQYLNPLENL